MSRINKLRELQEAYEGIVAELENEGIDVVGVTAENIIDLIENEIVIEKQRAKRKRKSREVKPSFDEAKVALDNLRERQQELEYFLYGYYDFAESTLKALEKEERRLVAREKYLTGILLEER